MDLEDEWSNYITCQSKSTNVRETKDVLPVVEHHENMGSVSNIAFSELYISTKTKVLFVNQPIALNSIFWNIPIIEYWKPCQGVVKKQMKIVSKTIEEYNEYTCRFSFVNSTFIISKKGSITVNSSSVNRCSILDRIQP